MSPKIGCTGQTLNERVKKNEVNSGVLARISAEVVEKAKAPEREDRKLRQANEILLKASAYFPLVELDRRSIV